MRGKRFEHGRHRTRLRIIPAHAGQTSPPICSPCLQTDHPRTCGANIHGSGEPSGLVGSSPHMRGKQVTIGFCDLWNRIIPAHAGQTTKDCPKRSPHADHPRTCGANRSMSGIKARISGSSPHMRGKLSRLPRRRRPWRIIPAHAGQTWAGSPAPGTTPDHPRTCGANSPLRYPVFVSIGSSPHMRGKLAPSRDWLEAGRIIPAHAGQTYTSVAAQQSRSDHPRTCGANSLLRVGPCHAVGSSPHMRGKLKYEILAPDTERIIPAHAGQTVLTMVICAAVSDHPRTCGANTLKRYTSPLFDGSSPHMRGKLACDTVLALVARIIPAHAGQTWCRAGS